MDMTTISTSELCEAFRINERALQELINYGIIPFKRLDKDNIGFCPKTINTWMDSRPVLKMDRKTYIQRFGKRLETKYPETIKEIRKFADKFTDPIEPKRFYLEPVKSKKLGIVYYCKYLHNGKLIPSKWCTHTSDREAAEQYAIKNRDRLIKAYYERRSERKPYTDLYATLKKYYSENSVFLQIDEKRGRSIGDTARRKTHGFILNKFIPYLQKEKIKSIEQIETPLLVRFQNYLLADKKVKREIIQGLKPQTINTYMGQINFIFGHLIQEGHITNNPFENLSSLKVQEKNKNIRGCYEIDKLKGVFNKKWKDELSYLLSMVIYTTDMRNKEIERIQVNDIINISDYNYINIPESKTENGVRIVPLHNFVHKKIMAYVRKNKMKSESYIFSIPGCKELGGKRYKKACIELANQLGYTNEQLEKENITFYSGRHFWKTLMNSENLGDIEEYFMGHKVSGNVAKRYNHKDKQGKKKMLEKTKKVFAILDKWIFRQ
jgi:integrase